MRANWRFGVVFLAILAIWLGFRVAYWNGYYVEDAPGYVTDAIYLALGNYHARDYITGLNVGTYVPVALPLKLLGKSEVALGVWPLFCSLVGVLSLAGAAGMLFGRRFGLLAALLYATYPGDVFFSTVVMPDAIQAGWLALSVFLVVFGYAGAPRWTSWSVAGGGIAMGVCNLIRGNGPILLPVGLCAVVVFAWLRRCERVRAIINGTVVYLTAWVIVQIGEGVAYLWADGDVLHRFHVVNRHYGTVQSIAQWGLNTDWTTIPFSIFPPLLWWRIGGWGLLNQDQAYHGFIFCLALLGLVVGALALRFSRAVPPQATAGFVLGAFWFVWPLAYHQFGSQSVTHFVPIHRLSRHLVVYAPGAVFAVVASCFVISTAISRWQCAVGRRALLAVAFALLTVNLLFNLEAERIAFDAFHRIKDTYVRIREHLPPDTRTIIGDPGDLCFFDFWLNPLGSERVKVLPFANIASCDALPNGTVLTHSNPGWEGMSAPVIQDTVRRLPCLSQPPPNWRLLYDGFPEKIFVVGAAAMR